MPFDAPTLPLLQRPLAEEMPPETAQVAVWVGRGLDQVFDYAAPPDLPVGALVSVPFGRDDLPGIVIGPGTQSLAAGKLRPIGRIASLPPLTPWHLAMLRRAAAYTLTPVGVLARMVVPSAEALEPPAQEPGWVPSAAPPPALMQTQARRRVLALAAAADPPLTRALLARQAEVGASVVVGLIARGALVPAGRLADERLPRPDPDHAPPDLSSAQDEAAAALVAAVQAEAYQALLLDGVTGSGKTEVYFEAIAEALRQGRQSLILLPEIALTGQWLDRFRARFGVAPVAWHSGLTPAQRRAHWRAAASGQAQVVVGARSALFLPYPKLGLIVVDEEHDQSYKQEDGALYHARDMAVLRAAESRLPLVLASATPSLESIHNAAAGRYRRLILPARHGGATLPQVEAVDLRRHPPARGAWLSPLLLQAAEETLARGEQVLLFLNRRGFAPLTLCRACGERVQCHQCTSWMVEHRLRGALVCHVCGASRPVPTECPSCGEAEHLVACGPGVERIAAEVAEALPQARTMVLSSDTMGTPAQLRAMIGQIAAGEVDLVIGTQVIAKGHHFPMLTLVGVVDADLGLTGGDLRAGERTFQVLHQVSGRAGRAERSGRVLLQTRCPEHPVVAALLSGARDAFYQAELQERDTAFMPPFSRLVGVVVSARSGPEADAAAAALARSAPRGERLTVLGPAEAPIAVVRGRHRRRLLLVADRGLTVQGQIRRWLAEVPLAPGVRVHVDIDPQSFL